MFRSFFFLCETSCLAMHPSNSDVQRATLIPSLRFCFVEVGRLGFAVYTYIVWLSIEVIWRTEVDVYIGKSYGVSMSCVHVK